MSSPPPAGDGTGTWVALLRNMNLGHAGSPVRTRLEGVFLAAGAPMARIFQTNGTVVFRAPDPADIAARVGAALVTHG